MTPRKRNSIVIIALLVLVLAALFATEAKVIWLNLRYEIDPPKPEEQHQELGTPDTLNIPSLGITAPVLYAETNSENEFQKLLQGGVVHYPGTANLGEKGNAYIFGHSSDFALSKGHYKTVFALLPKIQQNDRIEISDHEGKVYKYRVIETKVVAANDLSVLSQGDHEKKLLTLQTSYPVGTALKRFVAIAELVE